MKNWAKRKGGRGGGRALTDFKGAHRDGRALSGLPRQGSVPSLFLHDKKSEN